ncbi:MAG: cyclic lactone autoinducer peptide [Thermoanaerobacteraceae bacterium]|nr:cyclic lactone autoinducer peptide [Thermoanaerobacteraceae bacterium]
MWRKVAVLAASWMAVLAVVVAQGSVVPSSILTFYQPEVPQGLRK